METLKPARDPKVASDFPKFVFSTISDQIKQADTKAVGVLSILGIVTGALLNRLSALKAAAGSVSPLWLFVAGFSIVMIVITMKFIIRVVYPRGSKGKKGSLMYFKDVSTFTPEEYIEKGMAQSNDDITREAYSDAYNLAKVADNKYRAPRHAMILTVITIVWTIGVLLLS